MNEENQDQHKATRSSSYQKALEEAGETAKDEEKALEIVDRASARSNKFKESVGKLKELFTTLTLFGKMLRAYYKGQYKEVPWATIVKMLSGVIYFVFILDFIPDFIPFVGYFDDAAVLAWILGSIKADIDKFAVWEAEPKTAVHETA